MMMMRRGHDVFFTSESPLLAGTIEEKGYNIYVEIVHSIDDLLLGMDSFTIRLVLHCLSEDIVISINMYRDHNYLLSKLRHVRKWSSIIAVNCLRHIPHMEIHIVVLAQWLSCWQIAIFSFNFDSRSIESDICEWVDFG